MSLLKRDQPKDPKINEAADVSRDTEENTSSSQPIADATNPQKKQVGSQNRKNIKVSPDTFRLIENIGTLRSLKKYEVINELLENFIKNELTEREQKLLQTLSSKENI
ncbi:MULTISPECIES: hypothetical protein [Bacillus cereus group]|uniref:hypothetical protein n=1 Tax=Bacillus cereus group TaxID=86661 RepID=UPI000BF4C188|nr:MULTISPECIES: hypothetical protein [Bacillus cereus group]PER65610.1 hypothetical protein CN502_19550 [Bacillus cereus]PGM17215.1 hypothetical protein CN938_04645 [Bacillus thuringiensis]